LWYNNTNTIGKEV